MVIVIITQSHEVLTQTLLCMLVVNFHMSQQIPMECKLFILINLTNWPAYIIPSLNVVTTLSSMLDSVPRHTLPGKVLTTLMIYITVCSLMLQRTRH